MRTGRRRLPVAGGTDWDLAAREAIAVLRLNAARHPRDPALAALLDAGGSAEFRRIWDAHEVDVGRSGRRRYRHPVAGEIELHSERFDSRDEPGQVLFTYSVVPGSASDAGLRRLTDADTAGRRT
ncbi:hypothetical protein [Actinomadura rugatobispora]|uniref:MmyB-like transcription regulator ligand binding domain-containing protein n=1 Tax=Actinomadura rugatobispora TaxID=1994 RepID=A0ABW1A9U9_9ACTN|nr:hypothetical protein GCM10010200_041930 [Actinomadura rugatobispora]